jgi:ubiquinone/menaquinone biosynthesis C-methylase UbiE
MSQDKPADQQREQQRAQWIKAAPGWVWRRDAMTDSGAQPPQDLVTARLLELARIAPGQRVLDLACGLGNPTFRIAETVGPQGEVFGLDFTPLMIQEATNWAAQRQIPNVSFRLIQSEVELGVPGTSFDAATCRFGLMFMPEPTEALRALHRALKPGGRAAVCVWGSLERFPQLHIAITAVARHITLTPQEIAATSRPTALGDHAQLAEMFRAAGFGEVTTEPVEAVTLAADTPEAYWDGLVASTASLGRILAAQSEELRRAIGQDAIAMIAERAPAGRVVLPGEAIVAAGTRER